jgi:hypothetical protein
MRNLSRPAALRRNPDPRTRADRELRRQRDRQRLELAWSLIATPAAADAALLALLAVERVSR